MICINGDFLEENQTKFYKENRGYLYGDAVFETIRVNAGKVLFWETHYFRLMASMRIMRMDIPMQFTPEFLEQSILKVLEENELMTTTARVKLVVNRGTGGLYTPVSNAIEYMISATEIHHPFYSITDASYTVGLFKDHYIATDILSTLKTNNRVVNVLGSIFAKEYEFDNCIILNTNKMVIEALNGNLFLVKGNTIKTPPVKDGCLKGVMRTQIISILEKSTAFEIEEASVSPFELQKMDELFITNVITGIQPITTYKKKTYDTVVSQRILGLLNAQIRLTST